MVDVPPNGLLLVVAPPNRLLLVVAPPDWLLLVVAPPNRLLLVVAPKKIPGELAFEVLSLIDITLEPKRPPFGVAIEASLLDDVAFEPKRPGDGVLDVLLLEDTRSKTEKLPAINTGFVVAIELPAEGEWVDALLPEGAEFEPNRPPPRDDGLDVPNTGPLLAKEPKEPPVLTAPVLVVRSLASGKGDDKTPKLRVVEPLVGSAVFFDDSVFVRDPSVDDPNVPLVDGSKTGRPVPTA